MSFFFISHKMCERYLMQLWPVALDLLTLNYPINRPKGRFRLCNTWSNKDYFYCVFKCLWDWLIDYYLWVPLLYQTNISKSYCNWNSLNYLNDIRRISRVSLVPKLLKGRLCVGNTTIQGMKSLLETIGDYNSSKITPLTRYALMYENTSKD